MHKTLPLSVIICTYNRAGLLRKALESLTRQTLSKDEFEVVIIDDGSSDNTREITESFYPVLPIRYFYQNNAGLASAKNHGTFAAIGDILLFFDDDDVATSTLLEEHLKTHRKYPEDYHAVLNYTTWAKNLNVTPLMEFVTDIGYFLFYYSSIKNGDILDYTYFWGGRSSCKRSFLINYGVFNPVFRFGCEDIELGYRLSKHGLKVVYNSKAVSMMARPIAFDDFCQRLIRQGRSQYIFSTLYNDPAVHAWAEVVGAERKWNSIKTIYETKMGMVKELDKIANMKLKYSFDLDDLTRRLLYWAYWWSFKACKIKGILEAKEELQQKNNYQNSDGDIQEDSKKIPLNMTDLEFPIDDNKSFIRTDLLPRQETKKLPSRLKVKTTAISSYEGYKEYVSNMQYEYIKREYYEKIFIVDSKPFNVEGYCYICNQEVQFFVDYSYSYEKNGILTPNWREHLLCPLCRLNNRMRASIHLFEQLLEPSRESRIYISEQVTPLYKWFVNNYSNIVGSEYLGRKIPLGKTNAEGIRNESINELSFSDNEFGFIISLDVFEHVPKFQKAFRECFRVLKQNGSLFFTVPFEINSEKNIIRAVKKDNNKIEYFLPPEYHGAPLNPEGCLAFYCFGWEILTQLKEAGFANVNAHLYWSKEMGYLGGEQIVFIADKKVGEISNNN